MVFTQLGGIEHKAEGLCKLEMSRHAITQTDEDLLILSALEHLNRGYGQSLQKRKSDEIDVGF